MSTVCYRDLGEGVTCIDANYGGVGNACFYLLQHGEECVLIETGTGNSLGNLSRCMADKHLSASQVKYIVPTHVHLDHAGGAGAMMALCPQASLVVHPKGARHLIDPEKLVASSIAVYGEETFAVLYGSVEPVSADRVIESYDGLIIDVGGRELLLRHTAGHADHHFCVWDACSRGWFSGDMFGVSYLHMRFPTGNFTMASTTPTQFNPDEYPLSVGRLREMKPERMFLTHYSELPFSDRLADSLIEQAAAYAQFALELGDDVTALENRIKTFTAQCMMDMGLSCSREQALEAIRFDAKLNAQGLAVWVQRRRAQRG